MPPPRPLLPCRNTHTHTVMPRQTVLPAGIPHSKNIDLYFFSHNLFFMYSSSISVSYCQTNKQTTLNSMAWKKTILSYHLSAYLPAVGWLSLANLRALLTSPKPSFASGGWLSEAGLLLSSYKDSGGCNRPRPIVQARFNRSPCHRSITISLVL